MSHVIEIDMAPHIVSVGDYPKSLLRQCAHCHYFHPRVGYNILSLARFLDHLEKEHPEVKLHQTLIEL